MTQPLPPNSAIQPYGVPSNPEVAKLHTNSDADSSTTAQHHTLGIKNGQAAGGDHTHNGKNSKKIGKGLNISFPTTAAAAYSQAQMQAVIDALKALGLGT